LHAQLQLKSQSKYYTPHLEIVSHVASHCVHGIDLSAHLFHRIDVSLSGDLSHLPDLIVITTADQIDAGTTAGFFTCGGKIAKLN